MDDIKYEFPENQESLGILGYLIIINKQIHNYQLYVLDDYFTKCNVNIEDTCLNGILDAHDDVVSYQQSLLAYFNESITVQEFLLYVLVVLSNIDEYIDNGEKRLIEEVVSKSKFNKERAEEIIIKAKEQALQLRKNNNILFIKPYSEKITLFRRIIDYFASVFNIKKLNTDNMIKINGKYKSVIETCAEIAKEDFSIIKPSYVNLIEKGNEAVRNLKQITNSVDTSSKDFDDALNAIKLFSDNLSEKVLKQSKETYNLLNSKERTLQDFTITLVGRTKAGKSTLHSIFTGEGNEKIGRGMQRTTRYNRVYQWNLLRIIDTPGIGSAEEDGRIDEEIAYSVIEESDIVCFVIVDDSILDDIFEFIQKIAQKNKPVIILLNHKENINHPVKFKRYIGNNKAWLTDKGENNLQGHINRIFDYAKKNGFDSMLSVYPVFLLPALMIQDPKYANYSKILWDGSNLDVFIEELKKWINILGPIKRSQTIIDGTIQNFGKAKKIIAAEEQFLYLKTEELKEKLPRIKKVIEREKEQLKKNLKTELRNHFIELATKKARYFAEKNYDYDGDLSQKWNDYLKKIKFEENIKTEIESQIKDFLLKLDDIVREVFDDFYFSLQMDMKVGRGIAPSFDANLFTKILSSTLGLVAGIIAFFSLNNPIGWIFVIGSIIVGLSSNLFKSKEEKRRDAIKKIYNNLNSSINNNSEKQINLIIEKVDASIKNIISKIENLFDNMIKVMEQTSKIGNDLINEYKAEIAFLNTVYAWRILCFLEDDIQSYDIHKINELITKVERSDEFIKIFTNKNFNVDTDILKNIIVEKILIERDVNYGKK